MPVYAITTPQKLVQAQYHVLGTSNRIYRTKPPEVRLEKVLCFFSLLYPLRY